MKKAHFTKALTVALPKEIYLKIKAVTDQKNISMGEWVRLAAERALNEEHQCKLMETSQINNKKEKEI